MSWESVKKSKQQAEENAKKMSTNIFLKDGESVEGVFRGEPEEYWQKWIEGAAPLKFNAPGKGLAYRFQINFITKDEKGNYVAKIFDCGRRVSNQILELKEEIGLDTVFKIKRSGSEMHNTVYTFLPKGPLTTEQAAVINAIPLQKLESGEDISHTEPSEEHPPIAPDEKDVPF